MATDRLLVEESVHDEFIEKLKHILDTQWKRPFPLVQAAGAMRIRSLVQDALDKGASLAYGVQSALSKEDMEHHHKMTTLPGPLLVTGVTKKMDIYHLENFGPIMSVMTFNGEEEGIKLANDSMYGLSASVWTQDLAKGIRVAHEVVSGWVKSALKCDLQ
jgi:acyl-CoA reductase-like NAD-dependent aldehyde dehydrogenase